jgi:serine/threonine protein kinase/thioredoxin-like negative regulator of GroEL
MIRAEQSLDLRKLVESHIDRWRRGARPDTAEVLAEHPELYTAKSLLLDLALEEYALRQAAGEPVRRSTFCDRFPAFRQSLARLLEVHELLDRCPPLDEVPTACRWPTAGETFLGYELLEPLGVGGLARVFLARELDVGQRPVVVKISPLTTHEAHTLGKLVHPGIVPIHSACHDETRGLSLICMPLLGVATCVDLLDAAFAEGTLRSAALIPQVARDARTLAEVPLPEPAEKVPWHGDWSEAVATLGLHLAEALDAAHQQGILHRDIKPSNVLLAWSGRPMLLDFNLATHEDAAGQRLGGTLAYMAPEVIAALRDGDSQRARTFDPRLDIYSLGVLLFELLTGKLPHTPQAADQLPPDAYTPWWQAKQQPVVRDATAKVDPALYALVERCLSADPQGRFSSMRELAAALRQWLARRQAARQPWRRQRRFLVAAGATLLLAGSVAGAVVGLRPAPYRVYHAQGLRLFAEGRYSEAVQAFTQSLNERPEWAPALYGRGRALCELGQWAAARDDFLALAKAHEAWACALAGYCEMQLGDYTGAREKLIKASRKGLNDKETLLTYAAALNKFGWARQCMEVYAQVLALDPHEHRALRGRSRAALNMAIRARRQVESFAFDDAARDVALSPHSLDALRNAAEIYGYAARLEPNQEEYLIRGREYFKRSLKLGMSREMYRKASSRLAPLLDGEIERLLEQAPELLPDNFDANPLGDLPRTADWEALLQTTVLSAPDLRS